jgi:Cu/Ag efflux protein CusF
MIVIMLRSLLLSLLLAATGCGAQKSGHPLRGVVTRVIEERKLVMVQHEEIPGFMRAMTMAFSVPDSVWPQLRPGTHLTATLQGSRGQWRLEDVQLTDENYQPLQPAPTQPGHPATSAALPSPAGPGAMGASLVRSDDGAVYLSWLEPQSGNLIRLRCAKFDGTKARWLAARTIATGPDWFVNWADFPGLAAESGGRLTAVWYVGNPAPAAPGADEGTHAPPDDHAGYKAWLSQSLDDGATWSAPAPLTRESESVAFVSLVPLAHGGLLAVWLDGRANNAGSKTPQLYGRLVGTAGPDRLIDDSVCDCCQTTLTAFPDGTAIVAYRARRAEEVRDIYTAKYYHGKWETPRVLSADDWRINGCPVNGPQLDSAGGRVAAVWFTAADNAARVLASVSPDAGARFTLPQRVDLGKPLGRADTVLLRDGSRLVTWLEAGSEKEAGIYLRRLSPMDEAGPPVLLAASSQAHPSGFPRLVLVKDYDATPAQLLLAYIRDATPSTVHTLLLTLPDLSTLAGRKPCLPCDEEDANAVRGYPVKGRVLGTDPERGQVLVQHEEIPGVMRAMTMAFKVEPAVLPSLQRDRELLGRIERRGREWWLFNIKLLGAPPQ